MNTVQMKMQDVEFLGHIEYSSAGRDVKWCGIGHIGVRANTPLGNAHQPGGGL
jgi:hypothetical protein